MHTDRIANLTSDRATETDQATAALTAVHAAQEQISSFENHLLSQLVELSQRTELLWPSGWAVGPIAGVVSDYGFVHWRVAALPELDAEEYWVEFAQVNDNGPEPTEKVLRVRLADLLTAPHTTSAA